MANAVYLHTHDGLAAIVSARAATSILDSVLLVEGRSADAVEAEEMSRLLLGPIFEKLEGTLPRDGLMRNLQNLVANLEAQSVKAPPSAPPAPPPTLDAPRAAQGLFRGEDATAVMRAEPATRPDPNLKLDSVAGAVIERQAEDSLAGTPAEIGGETSGRTERIIDLPLSDEVLETAVLRFAHIEGVNMVAAVRAGGEVALSRGGGVDLPTLSSLGLMGLKLLRRSGGLRSYYLSHTQGQLFLLPLESDTLLVVGSPEVNTGLIFATLATLKEEL